MRELRQSGKDHIYSVYTDNPNTKILLEVPHCGTSIPDFCNSPLHPDLKNDPTIFDRDNDGYAFELYHDLGLQCAEIYFKLRRAICDANRNPDDVRLDGVIKTHTSQGIRIWNTEDLFPPQWVGNSLINGYSIPYLEALHEYIRTRDPNIVVFGHTMPGIVDGAPRSLFMLGNNGDEYGNPNGEHYPSQKNIDHIARFMRAELKKEGLLNNRYLSQFGGGSDNYGVLLNVPYNHSVHPARTNPPEIYGGKRPLLIEANRLFLEWLQEERGNIDFARKLVREAIMQHLNYQED